MNELTNYIENSPLVQAAITEAVHRFYYDRVGSGNLKDAQVLEQTQASDILSTRINANPDWRLTLHKTALRYNAAPVKALCIYGKPKNLISLNIKVDYTPKEQ